MLRLLLTGCIATPAFAQSPALLESVRAGRADALGKARAELAACEPGKCKTLEELSLLTGVLELSSGDAAAAAKRLASVKAPQGLEAFHGWYLGAAQAWAGDRAEALKSLTAARFQAPPWLTKRIDHRLAELALDLGDPARSVALLDLDPATLTSPELLLTRALAREALKLVVPAQFDFKQLAIRFPAHPHGALAKEKLVAAGAWKLTFEEQVNRAQAWLDADDPQACLRELSGVKPPSGALARLALLRARAWLTRGRENDTEARGELHLATRGPKTIAAQALMLKARRLMRLNDYPAAREVLKDLDKRYPTSPEGPEGGYLAAWLALQSGQRDVAASEFTAFEQRHPGSKRRDEARWFRGLSLYQLKKYAEARAAWQSLISDFPKSSLVPQAAYWSARASELANDAKVKPDDEYKAVVSRFPGTLYGLLAAERLTARGTPTALPFSVAPKALEVKRPPLLDLAARLAAVGLFSDAASEVSQAVQWAAPGEALTWGHALQALGEYQSAYTLAARHLWGAVYTQRTPEALALMYPRPFQSSVEAWSKQYGLEPSLAWAIMRRESAFAPQVTSVADARGLMQLIPPTAAGATRALKLPDTDPAELYVPDWNIRLGTWYLSALMKRFSHPTLVAGAYNGGPDAVAQWAKDYAELPLDEWIEQIPYKETRGYVKQVTVDLFIYRQLYGAPAQRLSLEVPTPATGVDF